MRSGDVWLLSFLAVPLAGAPLLLHASFRRYGLVARCVFAGLTGAYAIAVVMMLESLLGWPWHLPVVLIAGAVVSLLLRMSIPSGDSNDSGRSNPSRFGVGEWIALFVIVVAVAAATAATVAAAATSPDLLLFWGPKAEGFAAARGFDPAYLGDPLHHHQHVSYPPLVPGLYAFATIAAGRFPWMGPVATFPILLAALALALPPTLARFAGRRNSLVATAMIVASVGFLGDVLDIAGNADPALLVFEVLAVAVLMGAPPGDAAGELLAGVLLGAAAAAKVEGLPFVMAASALFLFIRRSQGIARSLWTATRIVGPSAAAIGLWFVFGATRGLFRGYETYGPTFVIYLRELGVVFRTIGGSLAECAWGLPWAIPLLALLWTGRRSARALSVFPAAIAGLLTAFFVFTYVHVPDPTMLVRWSAGRIFMIVSSLLVLAVLGAYASPDPSAR